MLITLSPQNLIIFMNKSCVHNLRIHFLKCHVKLTHAGNLFVTFFSFLCVCACVLF